jgi:hypothetical protein
MMMMMKYGGRDIEDQRVIIKCYSGRNNVKELMIWDKALMLTMKVDTHGDGGGVDIISSRELYLNNLWFHI